MYDTDVILDFTAESEEMSKKMSKSKSYRSMYEYKKNNLKYIDRYGDVHYKRKIKKCVVDRYGDVVKVITI